MEEYKLLREEILNTQNVRHSTINILYTGVAAVLALAVNAANPLIALMAFCVIFPTYMIVLTLSDNILKMGAYLQVFQEDSGFQWESRLSALSSGVGGRGRRLRNGSLLTPFLFLSIVSLGVFALYFFPKIQMDTFHAGDCLGLLVACGDGCAGCPVCSGCGSSVV